MLYIRYWSYKNKIDALLLSGIVGVLSVAVLIFSKYSDSKLLEFRLGILLIICLFGEKMFYMYFSETNNNEDDIEHPFLFILSGGFLSFIWLLYALILNSGIMVVSIFYLDFKI